ncbi:MAG TPA: hypothetical protein VGX94_02830 [Terriglobia bacterium]|nr:hypothetical protein [Terriglobia bacterium]
MATDQVFYPWGVLWQGADMEDPTFAGLFGDDVMALILSPKTHS